MPWSSILSFAAAISESLVAAYFGDLFVNMRIERKRVPQSERRSLEIVLPEWLGRKQSGPLEVGVRFIGAALSVG